jgi:arylsulfatase A-like enzyme
MATSKPNIVLVSFDAFQADYVGEDTPHLTDFSTEAQTYSRAYCAATWTLPSFQSTFTGRWPQDIYAPGDVVDKKIPMLGEYMSKAGYHCRGLEECSYLRRQNGFGRGFDIYLSAERGGGSVNIANKWLRAGIPEPFFLFVHIYLPHAPYGCPKEPGAWGGQEMNAWYKGQLELTDAEKEDVRRKYRCNVTKADEFFGKLWAQLKESGVYPDCWLMVTADHGEELWEHGLVGHGTAVFDEQALVPLMVHWPGHRRGKTTRRLTSLVDILPTLGKICGFKTRGPGVPLTRRHDGRRIFVEKTTRGLSRQAVISGRYKYVWYRAKDISEIFDMTSDPMEQYNIIDEKPRLAAKLLDELKKHNRQARLKRTCQGQKPNYTKKEIQELKALGYLQ